MSDASPLPALPHLHSLLFHHHHHHDHHRHQSYLLRTSLCHVLHLTGEFYYIQPLPLSLKVKNIIIIIIIISIFPEELVSCPQSNCGILQHITSTSIS